MSSLHSKSRYSSDEILPKVHKPESVIRGQKQAAGCWNANAPVWIDQVLSKLAGTKASGKSAQTAVAEKLGIEKIKNEFEL